MLYIYIWLFSLWLSPLLKHILTNFQFLKQIQGVLFLLDCTRLMVGFDPPPCSDG